MKTCIISTVDHALPIQHVTCSVMHSVDCIHTSFSTPCYSCPAWSRASQPLIWLQGEICVLAHHPDFSLNDRTGSASQVRTSRKSSNQARLLTASRIRTELAGACDSHQLCGCCREQTLHWAIWQQLKSPPPEFEGVIKSHFRLRKDKIKSTCKRWVEEASAHNSAVAKRMQDYLDKFLALANAL